MPPVSCWRRAAFAPNHSPFFTTSTTTILLSVTLETLEKPPICLRLVRVNRINPCPSRFKAESACQRITLRLPSSIRQLGRSALTTQPPPLLRGENSNGRCMCGYLSGLMRLCTNLRSDLTWALCSETIIITDIPPNK